MRGRLGVPAARLAGPTRRPWWNGGRDRRWWSSGSGAGVLGLRGIRYRRRGSDSGSLVRPRCLCGPESWSQKKMARRSRGSARVARLLCVLCLRIRVSLVGDVLDLTGRRPALHAGSQRSAAPATSSLPDFSSSFFILLPAPCYSATSESTASCASAYASPIAGSFPGPPANGAPSLACASTWQQG